MIFQKVAEPGFDITGGGVDFVNVGGGGVDNH